MNVVFGLDMTGLQKIGTTSSKLLWEFLAPDGTGANNGKFHSLVLPPGNITLIITQFIGISNGDVAYCQDFLWLTNKLLSLVIRHFCF